MTFCLKNRKDKRKILQEGDKVNVQIIIDNKYFEYKKEQSLVTKLVIS